MKTDKSPKSPRKRRAVQQAFVVTVVAATAAAGGCDEVTTSCGDPEQTCNPPAVECPTSRPAAGADCTGSVDAVCDFAIDTACGADQTVTLVCALDPATTTEIWKVTTSATCDQPIDCSTLDPTVCGVHTQCRYLVPGCSDNPPPAGFESGGCFPAMDCGAAECATDETCTVVVYDPCFQSECAACGSDASVCLPTPGGA